MISSSAKCAKFSPFFSLSLSHKQNKLCAGAEIDDFNQRKPYAYYIEIININERLVSFDGSLKLDFAMRG